MDNFDRWYSDNHEGFACRTYDHKDGAESAWYGQQDKIKEVIERIKHYPCDMSAYLTLEELQAAKRMKETIIKLLQENNQ